MEQHGAHDARPYLTQATAGIEPERAWCAFLLGRVARAEDALWGPPGQKAPDWARPFTDRARADISRALLERLTSCALPAAQELLDDRMLKTNPVLALGASLATHAEREQAAASLLADMETTDGSALFDTVPLLPALLDREQARFVGAMREMAGRLAADAPLVARTFFGTDDLGAVLGVTLDAGDTHCGGRTVCVIETTRGRLLYKPRDCRLAATYSRLVSRYFSDVMLTPAVVAREGYGWCAFVEGRPVTDEAQVEAFFHRMGAAQALAHALCSTDLHFQNWIACADMPALVDVETVVTPQPHAFGSDAREERRRPESFTDDFNRSVAYLGMMPLVRNGLQLSPLMNTSGSAACLPRLDGVPQAVLGREAAFFAGFSQGYERCLALRDELAGWLDGLGGVPVRFLVRNTAYYARLGQRLLEPRALRPGQAREDALAGLTGYFEKFGAHNLVGVGRAEVASLLEGDIPYFCVAADECDLRTGDDGPVAARGYFSASAVQTGRERLARLGQADKRFQLGIMGQMLEQAIVKADGQAQLAERRNRATQLRGAHPSGSQAIEGAVSILGELDRRLLVGPSGGRGWLGRPGEKDGTCALRPFLGTGEAGLGVFFAALASSRAPARARGRACELLDVVLERQGVFLDAVNTERLKASPANVSPGLLDGIGGALFGLARMHGALGDERCVLQARRILGLASDLDLHEMSRADLYGGLAGLVAGLAACARLGMAGEADVSLLAAAAAERLLELRGLADPTASEAPDRAADAPLLWDTSGKGRPIGGAGHGQIGIACALVQAAALAPLDGRRADWLRAAGDALAFEARSYSDKLGTWPDFRVSSKPTSAMHGLCSGAPGAGLAYLRMRELAYKADMPAQMRAALDEGVCRAARACAKAGLSTRDHLCCGNAGVLDFLVELCAQVPQCVDEPTLQACRARARESAAAILAPGWRFMSAGYRDAPAPGLFHGMAGTGYELLRYAHAESGAGATERLGSALL